jgi:hypothetical protein
MQLRRLNATGIEQMRAWLERVRAHEIHEVPIQLLEAQEFSEALCPGVSVEQRSFSSRFEWGAYIESQLADIPTRALQLEPGVWAWLTLVYFEQVLPANGDGVRKVKQLARYIPTKDFRTYYRHLLAGPWAVYRAHREDPHRVRALLTNPLDKPGDLYEQIASRQDLISFPNVVTTVGRLYFDEEKSALKRGAGGSGPGSPRRFADVLAQFDLTYDVYGTSADELLKLLPKEFKKFAGE